MSTTISSPASPPAEEKYEIKVTESPEVLASSEASSSSAPPSQSNTEIKETESPEVPASSAASPAVPPALAPPSRRSKTANVESSTALTDSSCLVQLWSHDDDSVYTRDGPPHLHGNKEENNQQNTNKRSPSLIANEPLDFGSIFRTINAMRGCPPPPQQDDDNTDDVQMQQKPEEGHHDDKLMIVSPLNSSFAYADSDTETSTEKEVYETRVSYTRSFIEQMMSGASCASADSNSNLGSCGNISNATSNNLEDLKSSSSSPFPSGVQPSSNTMVLLGSSLALDLTTTDEDDDGDDGYEVQSSSHGGYDSILYDEESNANVSMMSVKTPVTKNGSKKRNVTTGASYVVDQLEDVTDSSSGGGGGVTSTLKVSNKSTNSSFSNDKEAWLYQHRKKVFVLLGLLVVIFGLVVVVMLLSRGGDSGTPTAEASSVNNNTDQGVFTIPDNYNWKKNNTTIPEESTSEDDTNSNSTTMTTNTTLINLMAQLNLTTFPTALLKARPSNSLNASSSLLLDTSQGSQQTVFAPLDSAFDDALSSGVIKNRILHDKEWGLHLDMLLRHHLVLDNIFLTSQLEEQVAAASSSSSSNAQQRQYLTMASGEKVALGSSNNTISGSVPILRLGNEGEVSVIKTNLKAENGVVHVVNGILRPKFLSMTVMDVLEQKPNLSTFARLIVLAGLDKELRNVDAEFTVFAPNNKAFEALLPLTMALLQSNNGREILKETLQRHLLSVVLPTTNDVVPVGTATTLGSGGLLLKKDASGVMSINGTTFTASDALASNGLVHSIGSVLLPTSAEADTPTSAPALRTIPSPAPITIPAEVTCGNFECPQYMEPKPNQECRESIADCQCITGYERNQNGACVMSTSDVADDVAEDSDDPDADAVERLCRFQCPTNARRRENRECWSNMDDCYCINGYQRNGNTCVQSQVLTNRCTYTCPPNSSRRPDRNCIESFDDCQCNFGTIPISIGCIRKRERERAVVVDRWVGKESTGMIQSVVYT